jgi:hypothetical protein
MYPERFAMSEAATGASVKKGERVVHELQRRAARGHPLNSGANRGDWLYAAAMLAFGSWERAIEASGFSYEGIKIRALKKDEVIEKLKELVATGDPILAVEQDTKLVYAANRHFGSWKDATAAAGGVAGPTKWTPERVVEAILAEQEQGLAVNSVAVMKRNKNLYAAGRRRFGTWAAALEAATGEPDPVVKMIRAEQSRGLPLTERAVRIRNAKLHAAAITRFRSWEGALHAAFSGHVPGEVEALASSRGGVTTRKRA